MSYFSESFNSDELRLPYQQWEVIVHVKRPNLDEATRRWLGQWEMWDLACSPMDDKERAQIRFGHFLGWFARS